MKKKEITDTMIRRFFRHLWESIKNLKRNGWMTLAAIFSVSITLTLVGIFAAILVNTNRLAHGIENNIQVNVFLQPNSTDTKKTIVDDEGKTVTNEDYHKVYEQIISLENVESITFSSKEKELESLQENLGDAWKIFGGDANPLSDVYIVKTTSPKFVKSVSKKIKGMVGVTAVEYGGASTEKIFAFANIIQTWGLAGTAFLLFVAIFLISNTIRITIISRRRDIEIMRLVGAKNSYIRGPFFLEGAWVGLLGAIVPGAIVYLLYQLAYTELNPGLVKESLSLYSPGLFLPIILGALALMGIIIGSLGSVLSMRRFLKI